MLIVESCFSNNPVFLKSVYFTVFKFLQFFLASVCVLTALMVLI